MSISMGQRLLQLPPGESEEYRLTPSEIARAKREKKEDDAQARRRAKSNKNLRRYAVSMIDPGAFADEVRYQWAESAREARRPGLFGDQPVWNLKATLVPGQAVRDKDNHMKKLDRRYSITRESTGRAKPQYVARFEGEWIGQASTRAGASKLAKTYEAARWHRGPSPQWVARVTRDPAKTKSKSKAKARDHACSCSHPKPAKKKAARRIPQGMIHVHTSADGRRMGNYSGNKNDTIMFMDPKPKPKAKRRTARDVVKECPIGTEIQTLILSQQMFNERQAAGWAKRHGFRVIKVDVTANNYRFRQHPPSNFRAGSFRTIRLRPGVEAVIGCPQ